MGLNGIQISYLTGVLKLELMQILAVTLRQLFGQDMLPAIVLLLNFIETIFLLSASIEVVKNQVCIDHDNPPVGNIMNWSACQTLAVKSINLIFRFMKAGGSEWLLGLIRAYWMAHIFQNFTTQVGVHFIQSVYLRHHTDSESFLPKEMLVPSCFLSNKHIGKSHPPEFSSSSIRTHSHLGSSGLHGSALSSLPTSPSRRW